MAGSKDRAFLIEDALQRLVENAIRNEETISKAAADLKTTAETLQHQTSIMPREVAAEVQRHAVTTATAAATRLTDGLSNINEAAEKARVTYERAVQFSWMKVTGIALLAFGIGIAGMVATAKLILPDFADLQALRQERAQLQMNIERLAELDGRAEIISCKEDSGRLRRCIRIDERAGAWSGTGVRNSGATYRIIYGY